MIVGCCVIGYDIGNSVSDIIGCLLISNCDGSIVGSPDNNQVSTVGIEVVGSIVGVSVTSPVIFPAPIVVTVGISVLLNDPYDVVARVG